MVGRFVEKYWLLLNSIDDELVTIATTADTACARKWAARAPWVVRAMPTKAMPYGVDDKRVVERNEQ
jgi:hypothetical protein